MWRLQLYQATKRLFRGCKGTFFLKKLVQKNLLLKVHRNHCLEIYLRKSTMLPVVPFSNRMVGDFCFTIYKRVATKPIQRCFLLFGRKLPILAKLFLRFSPKMVGVVLINLYFWAQLWTQK